MYSVFLVLQCKIDGKLEHPSYLTGLAVNDEIEQENCSGFAFSYKRFLLKTILGLF